MKYHLTKSAKNNVLVLKFGYLFEIIIKIFDEFYKKTIDIILKLEL